VTDSDLSDRAGTAGKRDYPRLFIAMNQVVMAMSSAGQSNYENVVRSSFTHAAEGLRAEKALLLLVEREEPLVLRSLVSRGNVTSAQVRACERGEPVAGVSAPLVSKAAQGRRVEVAEDGGDAGCAGVLCCPVVDPVAEAVVAVLYFQAEPGEGYDEHDATWLEGYAAVIGQAFPLCFQKHARDHQVRELLQGRGRPENAPDLIGRSAQTLALLRLLHEVYIPAAEATDPDPLLILGEKGTGKDLVARYLHTYSSRRDHPFVAVNCAEITDELAPSRLFGHKRGSFTGAMADEPGFFRAAHRGVLFLDEVAELSPRAQGALLRVLESRTVVPVGHTREVRVDVQILLATNRDLDQAADDGMFKRDLLDRFKTQAIRLEPLRERPWDIAALTRHFIEHHERRTRKKTLGLTPDALKTMLVYKWPGNVRELSRVCSLLITHAKAGHHIDRELLLQCYPDAQQAPNPKASAILSDRLPMRDAVRAFERELILARLEQHNWNARAARQSLGLPKTTFQRYTLNLGITRCAREL
jgi:DNA-binding NtrC family response regulator